MNTYAPIAAELRRIADDLDTLAGRDLPQPAYVLLGIQPGGWGDARTDETVIAAVDAVAGALLARPGATYPLSGGGHHHGAHGARGPVSVDVYDRVSDPATRPIVVAADEPAALVATGAAEVR